MNDYTTVKIPTVKPDMFTTVSGILHCGKRYNPYYDNNMGLYIPQECDGKVIYMLIPNHILQKIVRDNITDQPIQPQPVEQPKHKKKSRFRKFIERVEKEFE